jgi:hypothetical protein
LSMSRMAASIIAGVQSWPDQTAPAAFT